MANYMLAFLLALWWADQSAMAAILPRSLDVSVLDSLSLSNSIHDLEVQSAARSLSYLKQLIGTEALLEHLQDDIDNADTFWTSMVESSYGSTSPAFVHLDVPVDTLLLNASVFLEWLETAETPSQNPEQFAKVWTNRTDPDCQLQVIESLGGYITQFTMAGLQSTSQYKTQSFLSAYPIHRFGQLLLRDGTKFADLHCAFMDKNDGTGFRAAVYLWLPSSTPSIILEQVSEFMTTSYTNSFKMAYADILDGSFEASWL